MQNFKWEEILRNAVTDNKIQSKYLKHIPKIKDCDNWNEAEFLGRVEYEFKYSK